MASFGLGNALYAGEQGQLDFQKLQQMREQELMNNLLIGQKIREQQSADALARMYGGPAAAAATPGIAPGPVGLPPYKQLPQAQPPMPGQPSVPMVQLPKRPVQQTPAAPVPGQPQTVPPVGASQGTMPAPTAPQAELPYPGMPTALDQQIKDYQQQLVQSGVMPGTAAFTKAVTDRQAQLIAANAAKKNAIANQLELSSTFTPESVQQFRQTHDWNVLRKIQPAGGAGSYKLDDTTVSMLGDEILNGEPQARVLGAMGRGSSAARAQVMSYVANKLKEHHAPISQVLLAEGRLAANKNTLKKINNYKNMIDVIMNKNKEDINYLIPMIESGVGGGFPLSNVGIQAMRRHFGSDAVVKFENALQTVKNDYARVMSGPLSQGRVQQGAMDEANRLLNPNMTVDQIKAAVQTMRAEIEHEAVGANQTVDSLQNQLAESSPLTQPVGQQPQASAGGLPSGWSAKVVPGGK